MSSLNERVARLERNGTGGVKVFDVENGWDPGDPDAIGQPGDHRYNRTEGEKVQAFRARAIAEAARDGCDQLIFWHKQVGEPLGALQPASVGLGDDRD